VPSGSLLFATRNNTDNLYIVNSDGSGLKRLTSSAGRDELGSFSPDGSLIAYASRDRGDRADGIYVVSNDGAEGRRVAADDLWDWSPSWSSQGKILYEEGVQGYGTCWIVNPDGSDHALISDWCAGTEWSPDGRTIAVTKCGTWSRETGTKCSLSVLDEEGKLIRTLVEGILIGPPTWSPDGRQILFGDGSLPKLISIINADGTGLHTLHTPPKQFWYTPEWSRDGSQVVLTSDNETLLISPTDGSSRTISGRGLWSPDGSEIAMRTSSGIIAVSLADGSSRTLASGERIGGISWSPDGEEFAYVSGADDGGLYIVESDGSKTKVVDDAEMGGFIWSPDGKQILFGSDRGREGGVWWASPDGTQRGRLEQLSKESTPPAEPTVEGTIGGCKKAPDTLSCLSPDGRSEATIPVKSKVLTISDLATGATRQIQVNGADVWHAAPVWSNDGARIALYAGDTQEAKLYVVDVATGEAHAVAADAGANDGSSTIAWSPDDSYVYYAKGTLCVEGCHPGLLYRVHPDGTGDELVADMIVDSIYGFKP
jgi:Tol biopolymer transport system component